MWPERLQLGGTLLMTYCRFCWRVFWASASVLVLGCENPDLAYVELPNEPRRDDDASVTSELDEITTAAVVVVTSASESSVQPASTKTPESSNPARPADADVVDAAAVTSVDASLPNAEDDAGAQDADSQSETTTSSSHSADAEPVVPADAQGDGDGDAEEEASIICDCPDEVNPCLTALCLAGLTICTFTPRPGADCDDGNSCTQSDTCDDSGECSGTPKDCSDKDGVCVEGVVTKTTVSVRPNLAPKIRNVTTTIVVRSMTRVTARGRARVSRVTAPHSTRVAPKVPATKTTGVCRRPDQRWRRL